MIRNFKIELLNFIKNRNDLLDSRLVCVTYLALLFVLFEVVEFPCARSNVLYHATKCIYDITIIIITVASTTAVATCAGFDHDYIHIYA